MSQNTPPPPTGDEEESIELPARTAMTILPIDGSPVNSVVAQNLLHDHAVTAAQADQTVPIDQSTPAQ
ncbi:MAG TPA: hypothetical protein VGQ62_05420 [Chloroflexota bacterium]|jgi:hypothetical protein|nr:hypothetical protein [Chloroflexota bacterium]